jgi:hypothetical protein
MPMTAAACTGSAEPPTLAKDLPYELFYMV